jgi:hypothetical protein
VAQAGTQARPWKQRAHTLGRAVKAVGEDPFDSVRRLLLGCRALKRPIGLGQSCRTGFLRVPEMPDHAATDNRRQVCLIGETMRVLLIGQEIARESEPTSGEHRDQPLVTQGTHQSIERHRRDMIEHGTELQTQSALRRQ